MKNCANCVCVIFIDSETVTVLGPCDVIQDTWALMHMSGACIDMFVICCFSRCAMRGLTTSCVEWTGYYRHICCMIYFYRLMSGMSLVIDGSMIAIGYLITYNDIDLQENQFCCMKQSSQQQLGFLF